MKNECILPLCFSQMEYAYFCMRILAGYLALLFMVWSELLQKEPKQPPVR